VYLDHLWLSDFRNYASAALDPAPAGLTVIIGSNGEGKTNLLEAVGYLASLRSFRGAPAEALVRVGAPFAVVRAEAHRERRQLLIEAEINPAGRCDGRATFSGRSALLSLRPTTSPWSKPALRAGVITSTT